MNRSETRGSEGPTLPAPDPPIKAVNFPGTTQPLISFNKHLTTDGNRCRREENGREGTHWYRSEGNTVDGGQRGLYDPCLDGAQNLSEENAYAYPTETKLAHDTPLMSDGDQSPGWNLGE